MATTDFKQIGFASPRDTDTSIYSADINATYGAINSLQSALEVGSETKTVILERKPYYANDITYNYRYYEISISNYTFASTTGINVFVNDVLQTQDKYKVVQSNAILFNSDLNSSDVVTVSCSFINNKSARLERNETNIKSNQENIQKIVEGKTVVKETESAQKIRSKRGLFTELSIALLEMVYPVGSIYMSAYETDPSTFLGGEWEPWGAGRVPVGVNTSDNDFSKSEKEGGSKTIQIQENQMPSHKHDIRIEKYTDYAGVHQHTINQDVWSNSFGNTNRTYGNVGTLEFNPNIVVDMTPAGNHAHLFKYVGETGEKGGHAHINIVQPYITCYMFKRIN